MIYTRNLIRINNSIKYRVQNIYKDRDRELV